jgi:hypothetical protein
MADHIALPLNYVEDCLRIINQPLLRCLQHLAPIQPHGRGQLQPSSAELVLSATHARRPRSNTCNRGDVMSGYTLCCTKSDTAAAVAELLLAAAAAGAAGPADATLYPSDRQAATQKTRRHHMKSSSTA